MVKNAVEIIAVSTTIVNGNVIQTFEADLFSIAETPSRGTKINAVSFEIRASDHNAAAKASVLIKSV